MDSERYQRVKALFFEASRRSEAERRSYLETASADDPPLIEEVETLLAAGAAARGFLESPAIDDEGFRAVLADSLAWPGEHDDLPEWIGRYRVIRCVGEGGMGRVFEAEQDSPRRRVALKVVRGSLSTRRALQRFEQEVQILGRLRHPGIAQIHEAGVAEVKTPSGDSVHVPFYAMEFIDGPSLTQFAQARNLSTTARLELIARICETVCFGHQRGIIHRDLKPSNILVEAGGADGEARPKVIDFGVARMLDHNPELTLSQTHAGQVVGTVAYMSPEQLGGDPGALDTRSDVYSLGVIIFELLTGSLPFDLGGKMMHEAARVIRDEEPRRLSSLNKILRGDVETIVAKALEKEPARRYQSASELGADLRRLLRNEPIVARPRTLGYQLGRFARRHRELVGGVAAAFLLLVAGVVGTSLLLFANVRANRDLLRLSALQDLEDLLSEAGELWPSHPEKIDAYRDWIQEAREKVAELPLHRSKRAELRAKALPQSVEEREAERERHPDFPRWAELEGERSAMAETVAAARGDEEVRIARENLAAFDGERSRLGARLDERRDWTFPEKEPEARWWNNQLTKLIEGLEDLERGLLSEDGTTETHGPSIPKRLSFARELEAGFGSSGEYARAWSEALPAIHSAYPGVALTPQLGLVPLGPDPDSKLWEFAHLETGAPAVRGVDGKLALTGATGLVFVLLPGGTFKMGAQKFDPGGANYDRQAQQDESPVHEVTLSPFFLSKYEMTQGQWLRFAGRNPSVYQYEGVTSRLLHPVEQVSWFACMEVCAHLGLSLPTGAQWEYGARGGTGSVWSTGNERESLRGAVNLADQTAARADASWPDIKDWPDLDDGYSAHAPVTEYAPNPFGLHNVHGNVFECCLDGYKGDPYPQGPTQDPLTDPMGCILREYRGGSFFISAMYARSANRSRAAPEFTSSEIGLRPARSITPFHEGR